ncbi:MAG: hypothetical protein MK052_06965 [Alphaproteobacteria bacterium]|nr:hypothetical protein [Alphaproteobacteria bacterium]
MRHTDQSGKREALTKVMNATYNALRSIEVSHGLRVGGSDFRPRIEYFHDAVRVLSHRPEDMYLPHTRLSVEHLAYDMSCLRYLQSKPLIMLEQEAPHAKTRNAPKALPRLEPPPGSVEEPVEAPKPVPPAIKAEIIEHYRSYSVMYAALFAESADINFQTRQNENDAAVTQMAQVEQMLKMVEQGQMKLAQVEQAINQIENAQIRNNLLVMLNKRSMKKKDKTTHMAMLLQQQMQGMDHNTQSMDKAHMNFLSGQMMMFQDAKDLVRKLSGQGMSMAGQFLETALGQSAGRGGPSQRQW